MTQHEKTASKQLSPVAWIAIALAFLPVFVKRVVLIGEPEVLYWLAWDYSWRFVALAGVILAYDRGIVGPPPRRQGMIISAAVFVLGLIAAYLLVRFIEPIFDRWLPYFQFFKIPYIQNAYLLLFDLFIGILLVSISEELAFRRLLFSLLERYGFSGVAVVLVSSAIFALIHLTSGLASLASTFIYGIVFAMVFYATGRLSLCIALHYIADFLVFSLRALESGAFGSATSS